ncbi:alpha/beta fold hydrolase [Candidatus Thorarchaeota archaeon]|nr:MAG: alpha/beta fold hydrolase [Candidatus Thorarchaeota archaeon]
MSGEEVIMKEKDIIALRNKFEEPHHLLTTSDNQTLFLRIWEPQLEHRKDSAILLLHGITAHSGPYGMIAEPLTGRGFSIYGLDLRGHGLSDGNRGDCPSKERFIKDLCESIEFVNQRHPKVILFGHSLGVLSSIIAVNNCRENIDGLVLLSGARSTKPEAYPGLSLGQKLKILGSSIRNPSKPVIHYYRDEMVGHDDPLFNFYYTYRFMKIALIRDFEFPNMENMPVYVGVGDRDELFSVDACQALHDEIPSKYKMFYVMKGAKHAEFPPGSFDTLFSWLDTHFQ